MLILIVEESQVLEVGKRWLMHAFLWSGTAGILIFYTSQPHQNIAENYRITHNISDGLTAYATFTGKQFIIINHDPFDWMDVTVALNIRKDDNQDVVQSVDGEEIFFTVPRIKTREIFTVQANQLTIPASSETHVLPTQAYSMKIVGKTPMGQSSWDGRWEQFGSRAP
jgi:hypothetical protein